MRFNALLNPLELWLYAERYLSMGTRSYSPFSAINDMEAVWRPDSATAEFEVPSFWVDTSFHSRFVTNSDHMSTYLMKCYASESGKFLLPVHPGTIPLLPAHVQHQLNQSTLGPRFRVSPTASTRTVLVRGVEMFRECPKHFLKLHFPGRISRFIRSMTQEDVIYQLWVSEQLQKARQPNLPDLAGGYFTFDTDVSVGFLIRSVRNECNGDPSWFTIPGYSLYGSDVNAPTDPPMMAQLHALFMESAEDFIIKRIVTPIVTLWVTTVMTQGIYLELHGQNVLFCFNKNGSASSMCFRDSDVFVDNRIRESLGLNGYPIEAEALNDSSEHVAEKVLSLCYDEFLVHQFLTRIASCAAKYFDIPEQTCRDAAITAFHAAGGSSLPLNNSVFYFDAHLHPEEQFTLVEQPTGVLWR